MLFANLGHDNDQFFDSLEAAETWMKDNGFVPTGETAFETYEGFTGTIHFWTQEGMSLDSYPDGYEPRIYVSSDHVEHKLTAEHFQDAIEYLDNLGKPVRNINEALGDPVVFETLEAMEAEVERLGYMPEDGLVEGRDYEVVEEEADGE